MLNGRIEYKIGEVTYKINLLEKNVHFDWEIDEFSFQEGTQYRISIISHGEKISLKKATIQKFYSFKKNEFIFVNGYQSWTDSREWPCDGVIYPMPKVLHPLLKKHELKSYGDYLFCETLGKKGLFHGWTYGYIKNENIYKLYASCSELEAFTKIIFDTTESLVSIERDVEGAIFEDSFLLFDFLELKGDERVFDIWQKKYILKRNLPKSALGWTSWYYYYTNISEDIILNQLLSFSQEVSEKEFIFQIDDGYQKSVGDWLICNDKFPRGMAFLSKMIHDKGWKAGLWLAPFVCEEKSDLKKIHPDFLLKKGGEFVVAGNSELWSGKFYALNIYHEGVQEYLKKVFDTILNIWNFDMVKLDFLYAACLCPPEGKTRGEVMAYGMALLRKWCGNKLILGCGVPLGSALAVVDYCRIGCDVGLKWEEIKPACLHYRERVSTIQAMTNALYRRHLNGRFFRNDPDVFLLRNESQQMNWEQRKSLFIWNFIFGDLLFTSDDIKKYDENMKKVYSFLLNLKKRSNIHVESYDYYYSWKSQNILHKVLEGFKPYANVYVVRFSYKVDLFICLSNLGDQKISFYLDEEVEDVFLNKKWNKEPIFLEPYQTFLLKKIR